MIFRNVVRSLAHTVLVRRLKGPFAHESGNCWQALLPEHRKLADTPDEGRRSPLLLFENRCPLGPPHCPPPIVRSLGRGQYVHSGNAVFFSASDNSNPNESGRTYSYSISPWLYARSATLPANLLKPDCSAEAIEQDLTDALGAVGVINLHYETSGQACSFAGKTVLELGSGFNCGRVLLFACYGARPIVADRQLADWNQDYHPQFYARFRDEAAKYEEGCDIAPLSKLIDGGCFTEETITRCESPVELISLPDRSVDVVFSRQVLEHVYDPPDAFSQLYRVTKPGGFGYHWIDVRDQRRFDKPLEYLLLSKSTFARKFGLFRGELGNRLRPAEFDALFRQCGFEVVSFKVHQFADRNYLKRFTRRLRKAADSPYQDCPEEDLVPLGGLFCLKRPES